MEHIDITLKVNGNDHQIKIRPEQTLLDALRDELGLMGAREGCGIGMCGACTVLVEGRPMSSCLLLAAQMHDKIITTVEGLAVDEVLHPVQQAYIQEAGFQCAYCTPGFILSTVALLTENPEPDNRMIQEALAGNLCRCGSYLNILAAVKTASRLLRSGPQTLGTGHDPV
jgi:aerobic carbon-monoxide dehydrogenase small subunit